MGLQAKFGSKWSPEAIGKVIRKLIRSDGTEEPFWSTPSTPLCPNCGSSEWLMGPRGGAAQNIKCDNCGKEYNYCPPFDLVPL